MATHRCPSCKLDVPIGVIHRDAVECLVHLVPRYRLLKRVSESQRKQICTFTERSAMLEEQVRAAKGQVLAYAGPTHERRVAALEQRMKFILTELDRTKPWLSGKEPKGT